MSRAPGPGGERIWLLFALGISLALATWVLSSRHYWPRYDSGVYISAATAVARGVGLRDITAPVTRPGDSWANIPGWVRASPEGMARPNWPVFTQYPPLLPLALAPLVSIGEGRFLVLQLLPLAAGLAALLLVYAWREALFPGPWPLTLLLCAGSALTLYATRVQSEAFHAVVVLLATRLLARADEDPKRLSLWAGLAGLALLVGIAVHVKLVFFAVGAGLWLLLAPRAPRLRRLGVSAVFTALAVIPALLFTFQVSWAGREGLEGASPRFTLRHNPYYWTEGWNPSGPTLADGIAAGTLALRAQAAGSLVWSGIVNGAPRPGREIAPLVGLLVAALLAGGWWRHRGGLLALPTLAYLAAVVFSPWAETRMVVPVLPLLVHALATAVARLPVLLRAEGPRDVRLVFLAAGVWVMSIQAIGWRALTPENDEYALEFRGYRPVLVMARVAADLPAERVVMAPVDNTAFALVTGRATLGFSPVEWKMSDARVYLEKGGAPVAMGPLVRAEFVGNTGALGGEFAALAGPRARQEVRIGDRGLVLEWVRAAAPAAPGTGRPTLLVPGRIHPRWMALSPSDRETLARSAIPTDGS